MNEKFCKDCKHHADGYCQRSQMPNKQALGDWLVTGEGERPSATDGCYPCSIERAYPLAGCGPDGKFWEPKEKAGAQ